jgi:hypothetical protein
MTQMNEEELAIFNENYKQKIIILLEYKISKSIDRLAELSDSDEIVKESGKLNAYKQLAEELTHFGRPSKTSNKENE